MQIAAPATTIYSDTGLTSGTSYSYQVQADGALADIRESIQELRYYREAIFVPPPGPDSATARQIAARYAGQAARRGGPEAAGTPHGAGEAKGDSGSAQ